MRWSERPRLFEWKATHPPGDEAGKRSGVVLRVEAGGPTEKDGLVVKKFLVPFLATALGVPAVASATDAVDRGTARAALTRMEQAALQVTNLVNQAKADNDAIKYSCLNDKSTQIKTVVQAAGVSFQGAEGLQGAERNAAFQKLIADADAVEQLREEATDCVGAEEAEAARTQPGDALARQKALAFDPLDPRSDAASQGDAPEPALPAVQAPGAASPTR